MLFFFSLPYFHHKHILQCPSWTFPELALPYAFIHISSQNGLLLLLFWLEKSHSTFEASYLMSVPTQPPHRFLVLLCVPSVFCIASPIISSLFRFLSQLNCFKLMEIRSPPAPCLEFRTESMVNKCWFNTEWSVSLFFSRVDAKKMNEILIAFL